MAITNVLSLTTLANTTNNSTWTISVARKLSERDVTNPRFPRMVVLDNQVLALVVNGQEPVVLPLSVFFSACAQANPNLSWPPNITTQPTSIIAADNSSTSFSIA